MKISPRFIAAPPALKPAARKAGLPPTRHAIERACFALTGRTLRHCPPRLLAAAVKRARKSGSLAATLAHLAAR